MKKTLSTLTLSLLLFSSCENESLNPNEGVNSDGKVRFAAGITKTSTKSATDNPIINTGEFETKIGKFNVTAFPVGSQTALMSDKLVEWKSATSSWEFEGPYWPSVKVDFYAYANWGTHAVPVTTTTGMKATDITIGEDVLGATGQKDLLVSSALEKDKEVRTALIFKHALTQVIFKSGNIDPTHLDVRIGGLRIVNVAKKGTMELLKATPATNSDIKWNNLSEKGSYHVQGLQITDKTTFDKTDNVAVNSVVVADMSAVGTTYANYPQIKLAAATNNAQLLIPQTFSGWNTTGKPSVSTDAYIELLAVINATGHRSNSATDAGDEAFYYCGTPGIGLNGAGDVYGRIFIPISSVVNESSEWTYGKAIKYIITFGDKESGSGGGGYDEDGNPVLVPIRFTATVDNWTEIDVPLLTVNFEATSSDIKADLVNAFSEQFINDVKAAKEPKIFKGKVAIKGTFKESMSLAFAPLAAEANLKTGSTLEYNFEGVNSWASAKTISLTVPENWSAQAYKAGATVGNPVAANAVISIDGTTTTSFILTYTKPVQP